MSVRAAALCLLAFSIAAASVVAGGSTWVLLARHEGDLGTIAESDDWEKIEPQKSVDVWTDDFSNILSVFKW